MTTDGLERATFAGGCFWCLEPIFADLEGVKEVVPGYAGGHVAHPTYEQVCTGTTGHAEAVHITFDPSRIAYRDLLTVFFAVHDPTTPNRQGADVGSQYRSVVFVHDPAQEQAARAAIAALERDPGWEGEAVVTEVAPFTAFYPAEPHHRRYFASNPDRGYCRVVIAPKVAKFRKRFADRLAVPQA
jgi:peptide-methionine (S)-S-oxide reductase